MKNRNTDLWIEGGNDRRQFLKLAGYGTLGLMTGGFLPFLDHSAAAQNQNTLSEAGFLPDLDISIVSHRVNSRSFRESPHKYGDTGRLSTRAIKTG